MLYIFVGQSREQVQRKAKRNDAPVTVVREHQDEHVWPRAQDAPQRAFEQRIHRINAFVLFNMAAVDFEPAVQRGVLRKSVSAEELLHVLKEVILDNAIAFAETGPLSGARRGVASNTQQLLLDPPMLPVRHHRRAVVRVAHRAGSHHPIPCVTALHGDVPETLRVVIRSVPRENVQNVW